MDDTQSSRVSDATATRKRRSSILKNQRAPRTPFSELEFNVVTPTDTGKSRRVSFSRRMGVAEFVTNEATTTWKNFYEEHNKSLETSGNEAAANTARPSISHIGKRIFDQQFEEVEAVDFGNALIPANKKATDFNISINNINLTQQLAAFDCTMDDKNLVAPQQPLELSSMTDHQSKFFCEDLTLPVMSEVSNLINVNFSVTNVMDNRNTKCDDLDEIQKDLKRPRNVVCPGLFKEGHISEYIEVDLNMTHIAVENEESDMSITDTVHSPKVQEVKSNISVNKSRNTIVDKDWTTDKENIVVLNPYAAPRETDNFAVNEIPDQVLVFDGKRLTVQSEQKEIPVAVGKKRDKGNYRQTLLSDFPLEKTPQRKTIVLNCNDDLPNFTDKPILSHHQDFASASAEDLKQTMIFDEGDISMTEAVPNIVETSSNRKLLEHNDMTENLSITCAVPIYNILEHNTSSDMRKTIIYNDDCGNISVTRPISNNILFDNKINLPSKRRTTVFDDENISFTQAVPENLIMTENLENPSDRTMVFQNNIDDISFTQALPNNIQLEILQGNRTKVFERSVGHISMTQAYPSNIILIEKDSEKDMRKQLMSGNPLEGTNNVNERNTIVFDNDTANISIPSVASANIVPHELFNKPNTDSKPHETIILLKNDKEQFNNDTNATVPAVSMDITTHRSKSIHTKRLTIIYDEHADVSMTQVLPSNILSTKKSTQPDNINSVLCDNEVLHPPIKEASLSNFSSKEDYDKEFQCSMHQNQSRLISNGSFTLKNMIVDNGKSITCLKHNMLTTDKKILDIKENIDYNESGTVSISKPIRNKQFEIDDGDLKAEKFTTLTQFAEETLLQHSVHNNTKADVLVFQTKTHNALEMQINKTSYGDQHDEKSKVFCNIEMQNSLSAKSSRSKGSSCNDNELMTEKYFEMQVNLHKKDMQNVSDVMYDNGLETDNQKISQEAKGKKSILHELLDMSNTSLNNDVIDKNVAAKIDSKMLCKESRKSSENDSNDVIFFTTENSKEKTLPEDYVNPDLSVAKLSNVDKLNEIDNSTVPALQCNIDEDNQLEDNLIELKRKVLNEEKQSVPHNRYYEKVVSSDLLASFKLDNKSNNQDVKKRKSFKEADDTKELLEMLSDFTDRKSTGAIEEDCDKDVLKVKVRRSMALEHKTEVPDPRRLSFAPKRQSIILSREDLLNNLSMAQAVLQQTHFEDSEIDDCTTESPTEINESLTPAKKSVKMSNEVVKTLHFEDESCSDASLKSDVKISPLKKTAFGETSYMKESKVNVIPTYLKDVSDNIKALMNDLVKPRPDQMPFEVVTPKAKKQTSTCSTQIQANLVTSSQIDLDVELHSNINSVYELNKPESLVEDITNIGNKPVTRASKGPVDAVIDVAKIDDINELNALKYHEGNSSLMKRSEKPVIVFDHRNPLNNISLAPPNYVDVHRYDPVKSTDALCPDENINDVDETEKKNQREGEQVLAQYNVESYIGLQSGDASSDKKENSNILCSDPSKPLSMDRSTEGFATELKNTEVNTVIVMKGNKELLEASSSLTLVDDALTQSVFDIKVEMGKNDLNSPVQVIYKMDDEDASILENVDSDFVSNDDEPMEYTKTRKRSYSPTRHDVTKPSTLSSLDVTPKPISKMQKISNSPNVYNNVNDIRCASVLKSEKIDNNSDKTESHKKRSPRKSKGSPRYTKAGTDVTVQRLITEYKITKIEQDLIEDQIIEAIQNRMSLSGSTMDIDKIGTRSPDVVSSCTSSKGQYEMQEPRVNESVTYVGSQPSKVDWQPDLKQPSSRNILTECDSGVNVVAKIDMLSFMGRSRECEWETSGGDTWVFRLLRARLRLRVRLAHRLHNALRTRVRADTPVEEVTVDAVPVEEKDPLAELCVRFAGEAMRYECGRGCARASDVPLALRRCAGVARVALRWARAMRDARSRLAYTLAPDGLLTLKVANISLRSVWEVSMRLELVVEDAREAAWPRAGDVCVRAVLADCAVSAEETARALHALSHDWGHVPRTVWKIFRYLKNKTRNDDFLALASHHLQEAP